MELVCFFVKDFFDAGIYQHFEAVNARRMGNVDCRVLDAGAVFRRLGNGVHFRMDGAKTVLFRVAIRRLGFINQAANIDTMGHPRRRAVIARSQNVFVPDDDRADFGPRAGRSLRNLAGDRHKVLIPAQTLAHVLNSGRFVFAQNDFDFGADLRADALLHIILIYGDFQQAPTVENSDQIPLLDSSVTP
jgi:hypothetical protein